MAAVGRRGGDDVTVPRRQSILVLVGGWNKATLGTWDTVGPSPEAIMKGVVRTGSVTGRLGGDPGGRSLELQSLGSARTPS